MINNKDLVGQLVEEVALEGLDGITIQGLWVRLEDRKDFGLKPLSDKVKGIIWNIMTKLKNLDFYCLLQPRKDLVLFDKINSIDVTGHCVLPAGYDDIYPHYPIHEENTNIGSCKDFHSRKKVTNEAINCTLQEAYSRWGMQLVIVADQESRRFALCGVTMDPVWEFSVHEYCILERIGRSRQYGEITQGEFGLKQVNPDNKMLFYYRKCLVKRDLVTVQNFILRIRNANVSGKILHLKRYSIPVRSKVEMDIDTVIDFLKNSPNKTAPYQEVSKLPLKTDLKRVLKKVKNFLTESIPYRQVYPNATVKEWKYKGSSMEKVLKVVRLVCDDKEDDEDEKDEEEESCGLLDERNRSIGVPLVRQAYLILERSHISGMTQVDIAKYLGLPHLQARSICRQLKKEKICGTILKDSGRQRAGVFYCSKFDNLNASIPSEVAKEKSKLLEHINKCIPVRAAPYAVRKRTKDSRSEGPAPKILKLEHRSANSNPSVQTKKITLKKNVVDDSIKTEITIIKPLLKHGKVSGILDGKEDSTNLSLRLLKRANMILKAVNELKIIQDTQKLQRLINEEEEQEGSNYTVDRKSVLRILEKLELEGHLQRIKVTLTGASREKNIMFICHPSITPQHSEIQSAIEQAKMKLPIYNPPKDPSKVKYDPLLNSVRLLNYDHRIGKIQYGFKPKFIRLRNMHFYLYYLIYNYTGNTSLSVITKRNILTQNNLDMSLLKEMGPVFHDKLDWKMFIPPLPLHKEYGEGWCLVSDILLRLPLFMFLSFVNTPYRIPGIMDYLEHPVRKYYLVKDLPTDISYYLTLMRKYIFTVSEILQQLAYIGLLQFGPQMMKEKDQLFIFLNKNACLVDTTPSDEGYNHITSNKDYEKKYYSFNTTDDLERYWSDLVKFAMNTKLGSKACVVGKEVVVEAVGTKKQMLDTLKAKTPEEALKCDIGNIPGDGLGAGGIDSDLFVHLKRNWYWSSSVIKQTSEEKSQKVPVQVKKLHTKSPKPEKTKKTKAVPNEKVAVKKTSVEDTPTNDSSILRSCLSVERNLIVQDSNDSTSPFLRKCHRKVTRLMLPYKKMKARKPYYDQKDKEALQRMKKLRVDWTLQEDNILLLCKVADAFMCPYSLRKAFKNYSVIREILHKNLPELSLNKTSRACQRRLIYMMKNPNTAHCVAICIEELSQDKELLSKYGHASLNRIFIKLRNEDNSFSIEEFGKIYNERYQELVDILINRLKSVHFNKSVLENQFIPNTLEEFYEKYSVAIPCTKKHLDSYSYREVENPSDIMSAVIKTIIHSSLACVADKTCYSYQLLHIYQQYPDQLLRSVMAECRSSGMISIKKYKRVSRLRVGGIKCLQLSTAPFKLSNAYMNRLQTKYQYEIFSNSFYFFTNLVSSIIDHQGTNINFNVANGGECALFAAFYSVGYLKMNISFPENVIILDPKLSETDETFSRVLKRFNELFSIIKSKSEDKSSGKGYETDYEDGDDSKYECANYEEFDYLNKNTLASAASRLALYALRDTDTKETSDTNLQHAHDYFVINPCKISISLEPDDVDRLQAIFTDDTAKVETLSFLKKVSTFPTADKRPSEEAFVTDLNQTTFQLLEYIKKGKELGVSSGDILQMFGDKIIEDIKFLRKNKFILLTGSVSLRFVHYQFLKYWVVLSYSLPRSVKDSLSTGSDRLIDMQGMIKQVRTENTLEDPSSIEKSDDTVLDLSNRKDSASELNPSIENTPGGSKDTLTKQDQGKRKICDSFFQEFSELPFKRTRSHFEPDKEKMASFSSMVESKTLKDMEVLIKPWIRVDGSLNRRVLDRLLGSVLSHILFVPSISVEKLQARFSPALQPAQTHELVLILTELDCLNLIKSTKKSICSLFSVKSEVKMIKATGFEEANEIIIEPKPLAIVKLGLFIGDKSYSGVYMDPESFSNG